ncbi:hypothetical protein HMI55_005965, partial [Coelomomyces lativittatus]
MEFKEEVQEAKESGNVCHVVDERILETALPEAIPSTLNGNTEPFKRTRKNLSIKSLFKWICKNYKR